MKKSLFVLGLVLFPVAAHAVTVTGTDPQSMMTDLLDTIKYSVDWGWHAVLYCAGIYGGVMVIRKFMEG